MQCLLRIINAHEKAMLAEIKNAKVMIDKIGEYIELHEGSKALARFNLVGVYQNHIGSIDLFKLGTIVSIEEIKACYEDLQKQGKFN